jgi:phosphoribosyl 1,2-cyclic phosphodiesterase
MIVRYWGVRGSMAVPGPTTVRYGGNTPCVTVEADGSTIVIDAGSGIRLLG